MKKGIWIICIESYEIDGQEFSKGRLEYSSRIPLNNKWRQATPDEIENKQRSNKGNWFNLKNFIS